MAREGEAPPKPPEGAFHFEAERLLNVIRALEAGDISECMDSDRRHAIEAMTHVFMLADLVPEFLDGFMHISTRRFAAMHHKAVIGEMAQNRADTEGLGEEWRAAIDYMVRMGAVMMKANGLNQEQAIAEIARQSGRGDDAISNIRRVVTRSKKRSKNK